MSAPLRWKLIAGFLLVFTAGLVAGIFLGAMSSRRHRLDPSRPGELASRIRHRMQTRLNLTPEQIASTAPILQDTASQLEAIRVETGKRVNQAFDEADRLLAPHLTPEQRAKLETLEAQHQTVEETSPAATVPSP